MVTEEQENCQTKYANPETVEAVLCSLVSRPDSELVSGVFRVLSDPTRVAIVHALSLAPLCNCDIASILGLTESAVSHQMKELRLLKLVTAERRGRMVYYTLADTHIRHILEDTLRHVRENQP